MRYIVSMTIMVTLLGASVSYADELCETLDRVVEGGLKDIALESVGDMGDNSAPRATLRQLKINNSWLQIQMNYTLAQQHHCAPRSRSFSSALYMLDAMKCSNAQLAGNYKSEACDQSKWTLMIGDPKPTER